ncbi:hypothetical protein SUNI508_10933 [Seiridium unicorne]|uniref:Uncharacterized protein n=1 Tax=Seiridium unicorne TaxID=138068 RepID=A0ABR2UJK6_9PEZI
MASLKGKVIVVTGAASGIGRATATLLAANGAFLSLNDINEQALASVKAELEEKRQANVITSAFDIRSQEACHAWIRNTVAHFGQPISGAANVAGVAGASALKESGTVRNIQDSEFDWVLDVNLKGTLNCLRAELPAMQEGHDGHDGGSIVNVASLAGIIGMPNNVPYVASKHAIVGLTRVAAKEEGPRAIRVNAVCPGVIDTPMIAGAPAQGAPGALARQGSPTEVAEAIVFLLSSQSSFINGTDITIDGGWVCSV